MTWKKDVNTLPERIAETIQQNEKLLLGKNGRISSVYDEVLGLASVAENT